METTLHTLILLVSVVLTGLSAGLFYAWEVSVIPGTRQVADHTYLQVMQSINRAILNPAFLLSFLGSPMLLAWSMVREYRHGGTWGWWLAAFLLYLVGTFGVTAFGNDLLEGLDLAELSDDERSRFRVNYETRWNRLHTVRTVAAILSFACAAVGALLTGRPA